MHGACISGIYEQVTQIYTQVILVAGLVALYFVVITNVQWDPRAVRPCTVKVNEDLMLRWS